MINSTSLNEAHYTLLKQDYTTLKPASKTTVFFGPPTKNVSSPAKQIGTPVLPTHQDQVLHRRGHHGEIPSSNPSKSRVRVVLSNNPRHQKVSPRKLASHRHPLRRRHLGTLGPHHFRCLLRHDCSSNSRGTYLFVNTKRPRAGTSNNEWNSSPNQRSSPRLGRGCSNLPDMYLRLASIEEANHWRLRANVLGDLE
jgi:hypothetical protein